MYEVSQRYNFESKSQHIQICVAKIEDVWSKSKIQFWKQITTENHALKSFVQMYEVSQRYNFESKSQRSDFFW